MNLRVGGEGMKALAEEVASCAFNCGNNFKPLYSVEDLWSTKSKQLPRSLWLLTAL
jgi:formate--tetrahydrofolate ligase